MKLFKEDKTAQRLLNHLFPYGKLKYTDKNPALWNGIKKEEFI